MSNIIVGASQGSYFENKPARPMKGPDWDRTSSDYSKGRLKGVHHKYEYPSTISSTGEKLLTNRPYNPSPGTMARDTPGADWNRLPRVYETHRLRGKTNDQSLSLDPFVTHNVKSQLSNFKDHFAVQNQLHPFKSSIDALPQAFAKHSALKDAQREQQEEFDRQNAYRDATRDPKHSANILSTSVHSRSSIGSIGSTGAAVLACAMLRDPGLCGGSSGGSSR